MTKDVGQIRKEIIDVFAVGAEDSINQIIGDLAGAAVERLEDANTAALEKIDRQTSAKVHDLLVTFTAMKDEAKAHKRVTIIDKGGAEKKVDGLAHEKFHKLLNAMQSSFPVMLVGPAGTGKTYAAEQVAKTFHLAFEAISVGAQTSKSDLLGFMSANNEYVGTGFRRAFEFGGVFLMDEIDAGNANVLVIMNAALSGTQCAFPDGMVNKHADFKFIGTANTYGTGASRQYVGRTQLDAATLDRFVTIEWNVDELLEGATVKDYSFGAKWHKVIKAIRAEAITKDYRVVISPRATMKGAQLLELGFEFQEVIEMTVLATASAEQRVLFREVAHKHWS